MVVYINNDFEFLSRLAKALSVHFGKNCEVAVHDLTKDYEHTIVAIENGHITGRKIGDGASEVVIEAMRLGMDVEDKYNYFTRTTDGRELKSSSIFVRDEKGKPTAILSINYDITDFKMSQVNINEFIGTVGDSGAEKVADTIPNNVTELLDVLIEEAYQLIGKPVNMMTREDKVKAIRYLEQRGALLIKKSGDKISKFFDISKYTLYGYLSSEEEA